MKESDLGKLREEIERLRRRYAPLLHDPPEAREAPARWTYGGRTLRWHVVVEEAAEPDIDVEILPELLVIRARVEAQGQRLLQAVLPVPEGFRAEDAQIRCEYGYVEIRLSRVRR
jgi:HSP20 family molecular chaperone IbpA